MKKVLATIVLVMFFGVCCIYIPFISYMEYRTYKDYTENGYQVECTAIEVKGTKKTREITAEYTDRDGMSHTYTLRKAYAAINAGDRFTALVLPDEPDKFFIKYNLGDIIVRVIIYGLLFLAGLSLPVFFLYTRKESKLLGERGRPVTGTIVKTFYQGRNLRCGIAAFETERGTEYTEEMIIKSYQHEGDSIELIYCYDDKGKLRWRQKD